MKESEPLPAKEVLWSTADVQVFSFPIYMNIYRYI
jgi:hypothetical protein